MKKDYYTQSLEMLIYLIDIYQIDSENSNWINWLQEDIRAWNNTQSVEHHTQAYGGTGSFNDLALLKMPKDKQLIFDTLKDFCYQFTFFYKRIHSDPNVLEKELLHEIVFKIKDKNVSVYLIEGLQSGDFLSFYKDDLVYNKIVNIRFTRDSVCMADDVMDNSRTYPCNINHLYESIITIVKEHHFLASISGNNVVWVLYNHLHKEILSYYTKVDKVIRIMNKHSIDEVCEGEYTLHFRYITSPKVRKEQLMESYNYKMREMYINGLKEELELCDKLGE
ncbi:DUF6966 domain-containing protein [Breznakia pachnodae]|uniref:DUF6966 domain-containing protein n=1 Tax=Breznakia pachnodae TaxID=265178 RepID=A0ABU0E1D1_9FIRM|nr:hypothetical protein [Breznakia pachnodae]MDQ0360692.1 hypothetical protein [Breznakia pachnodae]